MSDTATDSESTFEQDMCLEGSQDFEDDRDCNLSPDLLRMVEQDEKQIIPYKKSLYAWATKMYECCSGIASPPWKGIASVIPRNDISAKFMETRFICLIHLFMYDFSMDFLYVGYGCRWLISPKASSGHRFIFLVVDYFTKWVEAASYANVTKSAVSKFLKKEIICQYRMPKRIISGKALNLNNSTISEVCSLFKIKTPYRLKVNGAMGAAEKNMEKMAETYKDWYEKLPFAYRTFVKTSTGATHFFFVYGMEVVLPIKAFFGGASMLTEMDTEQTEDNKSYFPKDAVEQIEATNMADLIFLKLKLRIGKSYLPEVTVEQIEATSLISLKLQWSRLKTANLISLKMQWNRLKLQIGGSYLPEVAVEQVEATSLISLKLHWSRLKPPDLISLKLQWSRLKLPILISLKFQQSRSKLQISSP
ncbi:receptor-like protein 12 [Gossypium australe]|uniref:Receptor-like protein 12 n=1 Tax=Gossypium australe TaxID=47621 RepID=A0A5B6WL45_9ROSI|nr:receptor-like protein 12 [Gossypium australe]